MGSLSSANGFGVIWIKEISPYKPHSARNAKSTRLCSFPNETVTPHEALIDSKMVQTATQNRSTDPKKSGANTPTTMVTQSWIDLKITAENSTTAAI